MELKGVLSATPDQTIDALQRQNTQYRRERDDLRLELDDKDDVLAVALRYLRQALGIEDGFLWEDNAREWLENLHEHQQWLAGKYE